MKTLFLTVALVVSFASVASAVITINGRTTGPTPTPRIVYPKQSPREAKEKPLPKIDPNAVIVTFDVSKIGTPAAVETREKFLLLYGMVTDETPEKKPIPREEFLKRLNSGEVFAVTIMEESRCQVCKGLGTTGSKFEKTERVCQGCTGTKKQSVPTVYKIMNSRPSAAPTPTPVPAEK